MNVPSLRSITGETLYLKMKKIIRKKIQNILITHQQTNLNQSPKSNKKISSVLNQFPQN